MKKKLFYFCFSMLISIQSLSAQSQMVSEMSDAVIEVTGSFMDNPYHHANTEKVLDITKKYLSITDELITKACLSNSPQVQSDLPYLNNMKEILKCLDFVVASIAGYSRSGIDAAKWESIFHPVIDAFGWSYKVIHSTDDIIFYEYSKDKFRLVLAKNVRPKKDFFSDGNINGIYCYTYNPYSKKEYVFHQRNVFGGYYQFVECGDDETEYRIISKVKSKRGSAFD